MQKSGRFEMRCSPDEKERWGKAAGGQRRVAEWLRALANAACDAESTELVVAEGAKALVEKAKVPIDTTGVVKPKPEPVKAVSSNCPRWMHHRAGTYCGSCQQVN